MLAETFLPSWWSPSCSPILWGTPTPEFGRNMWITPWRPGRCRVKHPSQILTSQERVDTSEPMNKDVNPAWSSRENNPSAISTISTTLEELILFCVGVEDFGIWHVGCECRPLTMRNSNGKESNGFWNFDYCKLLLTKNVDLLPWEIPTERNPMGFGIWLSNTRSVEPFRFLVLKSRSKDKQNLKDR